MEQNISIPKEPVFFSKFASSIVGPTDDIVYPGDLTTELDWEAELAIVIGKAGKNIKVSFSKLFKCSINMVKTCTVLN